MRPPASVPWLWSSCPAQIAETGSIAVDGVSTATITSDAIKEAAAAALTAAGLNADDYKTQSRPRTPRLRIPPSTQTLSSWAQAAQA